MYQIHFLVLFSTHQSEEFVSKLSNYNKYKLTINISPKCKGTPLYYLQLFHVFNPLMFPKYTQTLCTNIQYPW